MKNLLQQRVTITAKELGLLPDFAHYSERTLYRKYQQMRDKLGVAKGERHLTNLEVLGFLGIKK